MRKSLIALLLLQLSMPTAAQNDHWLAVCKDAAEGARTIMMARQADEKMSEIMDHFANDSFGYGDLGRILVLRAYERSLRPDAGSREREVRDFENETYSECIKASRGLAAPAR